MPKSIRIILSLNFNRTKNEAMARRECALGDGTYYMRFIK